MITREAIDLVVTDVRLPGMSGLDLAARIRALPDVRQPAIIALTGAPTDEQEIAAMKSGCQVYAGKPSGSAELVRLIATQLHSSVS
jgi:two-component system response regulator PilR (NtrC family)